MTVSMLELFREIQNGAGLLNDIKLVEGWVWR